MPRYGRIFKLERLDLMLQNIREREKPSFLSIDCTNILNSGALILASEDNWEPVVFVLAVFNISGVVAAALLPKC